MRLFTFERRVVVQLLLTGFFGGLERVVVRLLKRQHAWTCPQPSASLCVDDRGAGKRSVLVFGYDEDEDEVNPHLSQPSARASERRQAYDMDGNSTWVFSALV